MDADGRKALSGGVLARLRRDSGGNMLALMAAMMVPMIAFTGAAIDTARIYVVKVRLQQACDAGALAGRKALKDTSSGTTALDADANQQAQDFFKNNFRTGWYQTSDVSFVATKKADAGSTAANTVVGVARTKMPKLVMSYFNKDLVSLTANCQARFDIADNDVVFVLDTTGSMSCPPEDGGICGTAESYTRPDGTLSWRYSEADGSKIQSLREAVVLFDQTLRAAADATTHIRYGFAPYSATVNIGKYLYAKGYVENGSAEYQTRVNTGDHVVKTNITSAYPVVKEACEAKRAPVSGYRNGATFKVGTGAYQTVTYSLVMNFTGNTSWTNANGGTCTGNATLSAPTWRYGKASVDTSGFAAGINATSATQGFVYTPGRVNYLTSKWQGCVEELETGTGGNTADLDPDYRPTSSSGRFRPVWPDVTWDRDSDGQTLDEDRFVEDKNVAPGGRANFSFARDHVSGDQNSTGCPKPAQELKEMTSQQIADYVKRENDFVSNGFTYHDVGMLWGARMLSPNGVFGESTAWPGRNEPSRSIVFMTDGAMAPDSSSYSAWGVERLAQRVTGTNVAKDKEFHLARFQAICTNARAQGVTIYIVAFGTNVSKDMQKCASPGQAIQADNDAQLKAAFESIAQKIAKLRITQ